MGKLQSAAKLAEGLKAAAQPVDLSTSANRFKLRTLRCRFLGNEFP